LQEREALAFETLFRSRRRLWLPVEHPLLSAESISLEDVARLPYVMLTVDEANQTASRYWTPTGLSPNAIFVTSSVEAVRSMVADGLGVTILSDMVYRPWSLEGQRIEQRNLASPVPSMDVGLAWRMDKKLGSTARADFLSLSVGRGA
jgi:DNA-binding transcriptional LysR family regulator